MTTMITTVSDDLTDYFAYIHKAGKLRSPAHARRWNQAILRTFGRNLDRSTKKKLAEALPAELAQELTRIFWLVHFRNSNLSQHELLNQVSRRSGNTDPSFARHPTTAVFHQLKAIVGRELSDQVAESLSPDVRQMWEAA